MVKKLSLLLIFSCIALSLSSCTITHVSRPPAGTVIAEYADSSFQMKQGVYHSVAPGETLWRISKMYEVDIETIKEVNRIKDVRDLDIGKRLYIPGAASRKHVITLYPSSKWKYIIIHHSATEAGSSQQFNKAHMDRGWQGIGYHFIIDNGTCGKDDGQIETSPRWIKQQDGAHCKADGMNEKGIGICLVGNFSRENVSYKQMNSLVYLVGKLKKYYKIPDRNIIGHSQVTGAQTECPG
ncbi:MAG: N-acetylmuramoyl-L-alanine amidase, partial [Candidatus Omnitrophota bacterium]